jgi:hypothetical protein
MPCSSNWDCTYKRLINTTSKPQQKALLREPRNIHQQPISTFRETSRILHATLCHIPIDTPFASPFSVFQRVHLVIAVAGKREFNQALQVNPLDLVAPALGSQKVQMPAEIPAAAESAYAVSGAFGSALDGLVVFGRVVAFGGFGVFVFYPSLFFDSVFPGRKCGRGSLGFVGELSAV